MTANIVNLNRARKARARIDKEKQAEANRLRFGASKAERSEAARDKADLDRKLDGAQLDGTDDQLDPGSVS